MVSSVWLSAVVCQPVVDRLHCIVCFIGDDVVVVVLLLMLCVASGACVA